MQIETSNLAVPLHRPTVMHVPVPFAASTMSTSTTAFCTVTPLRLRQRDASQRLYVELFDNDVGLIVDKHAPLKSRTRRIGRNDCRWLSKERRDAKRQCRRLECWYRRSQSTADKRACQAASLGSGPLRHHAIQLGQHQTTFRATRKQPGELCVTCSTVINAQFTTVTNVRR